MTLTAPALVYKSNLPEEHRAIVEANQANREAAVNAMEALAQSLVPDSNAWAFQDVTGAISMTGVSASRLRGGADIPVGMRHDTKARGFVLVPAKRTQEGKVIAAQMKALAYMPQSLGAPSTILVTTDGVNSYFGSAVFEVIDGEVYALYRRPLREGAYDKGVVDADEGWAEIPLSRFHAARERAEVRA